MEEKNEFLEIDKFEFHLRKPVKVAMNGRAVDVSKITIVAPSEELYFDAFLLEQSMAKATLESGAIAAKLETAMSAKLREQIKEEKLLEEAKKDEESLIHEDVESGATVHVDEKKSPPDLIEEARKGAEWVIMYGGVKLKEVAAIFEDLATKGCVQVNGGNITPLQWKAVGNYDKKDIITSFIGVFVMPSA